MKKVNPLALSKYTKELYPKLAAEIGESNLIEIEKHNELAAKIVSKRKDCDMVIYVGHSTNKTKYPDVIASFVQCKNGKRFYVVNGKLET